MYNFFSNLFHSKYPLPHKLSPCIYLFFSSTESWDLTFFNFLCLCFPFQTKENFTQPFFRLEENHQQLCDPLLCRPTVHPSSPHRPLAVLVRERSCPKAGPSPKSGTLGVFQSTVLWIYIVILWTWFTIDNRPMLLWVPASTWHCK